MMMPPSSLFLALLLFVLQKTTSLALNVVLAGGSGPLGTALAARLSRTSENDVTILCRNAFLAAAPQRVTEQFGWVGQNFLKKHPNVKLRDWDGGDLLDIVGQDWVGWQEDTLLNADVIVHLVGGYTEQRIMACERLIRESFRLNKEALHVTVSPTEEDLALISPNAPVAIKRKRSLECEEMVKANCLHSSCLRLEANRLENGAEEIMVVMSKWAAARS